MKVTMDHVTKIFDGRGKKKGTKVVAVDDFHLELPEGKLIGLLGPSGCGKSTALNLISGLESPTSGRILFDGKDVTDLPPEQRGVGLVFQNYALYPHLTVLQNILFPLQNRKGADRLPKTAMKEKSTEAAQLVQIDGLLDRRPGELSGGQQQRVAIARALVKEPNILLLDEPLSNLDARLRLQTREEIRRIQKETGVTTIFVTHDQEEAMSICGLIIVMKEGLIHQIGKPQDIYDDPCNLFVAEFLGTPPINVFNGKVENEHLYIGEESVLEVPGVTARNVAAGIRPEGFLPDPEGPFTCSLKRIEVMGRDMSVIANHACNRYDKDIRAIISSDYTADIVSPEIRFTLKPHKVLLFDAENGERIRTCASTQ